MARRGSGIKHVKVAKVDGKPTEIDGIPTAHGLTVMGRHLAYETARGIHITDEGHRYLGRELKAAAQEAIDRGEHRWVEPPSRMIPGITKGTS